MLILIVLKTSIDKWIKHFEKHIYIFSTYTYTYLVQQNSMQGWHYGKGLIYYRPVSYIYTLRAPDCIQTVFSYLVYSRSVILVIQAI